MKRINLDKLSDRELDGLAAEAAGVTHANTRPLTRESREALARAAGKGGRPRVGRGAARINITVERALLSRTDAYARKRGMTRAAVVADALRSILAA